MRTGVASPRAGASAALVTVAILAAWLGAAMYFATVVARAAFTALPTRTLAGALVAHTLPALFALGVVAGLLATGIAIASPVVAPARAWRAWGGIAIAASCAAAQLIIIPRIERLRASSAGQLDTLPAGDAARVAFGRLHAASVGLLGLAIVLALLVMTLTIVALARE